MPGRILENKNFRLFYGIALSILAILFGAFMFVYGGYDDSPGAQLLGLVLAIVGVVGVVKSVKNRKKNFA